MIIVSRRALWSTALPAVGVAAAACLCVGVRFACGFSGYGLITTLFTAVMIFLQPRFDNQTIRRGVEALELLLLFAVISAAGALASYVVIATSTGYVDDQLAAADRLLGFDWSAVYAFTALHPWFRVMSFGFYLSIFSTPPLLLLMLAWTDHGDRARSFLVTFALALAITVTLFHWFPARGALAHYGVRPDYVPAVGPEQVDVIEALRRGKPGIMNFAALPGIISFPSFHAASAIMFISAAWPVKPLRWFVLPTNLLMLVATPVQGSHYCVDLLGGVAVAGVAIGAVCLCRNGSRAQPCAALQMAVSV